MKLAILAALALAACVQTPVVPLAGTASGTATAAPAQKVVPLQGTATAHSSTVTK